DALYGTECVRYQIDARLGVVSATPGRSHDGVWTTPLDRSGKLVPGVLVAVKLGPWNVSKRAPLYWSNPLTDALPCDLPWQTRAPAADGYLVTSGEFDPSSYFGLSPTWPEADAA